MSLLEGKSAIVTGSSTGIGKGIAERYAREGANVTVNYYRHGDEAEDTAERCRRAFAENGHTGGKCIVVQADVSNEEQVKAMFAKTLEAFGGLDVLVNNAGIQKYSNSDELELADFDKITHVNLRGTFLCSREALKHFLARPQGPKGGVILNNSSVHEIIPKPGYVSYSMSKGGMENMTKSLALEYARRGIRVNAVGPGAILTPINDAWRHDEAAKAAVEAHIPMGRAGVVEEIASVFAFLASEEASYITGQTIFACGGLTLYPEFADPWSSGGE